MVFVQNSETGCNTQNWHDFLFQPGVPAFTVPQPENAMAVVADRAREIKVFILSTANTGSVQITK